MTTIRPSIGAVQTAIEQLASESPAAQNEAVIRSAQQVTIRPVDTFVRVMDNGIVGGTGMTHVLAVSELERTLAAFGVSEATLRGRTARNLSALGRDLALLSNQLGKKVAEAQNAVLSAAQTGGPAAAQAALARLEGQGTTREMAVRSVENFLEMLLSSDQLDAYTEMSAQLGDVVKLTEQQVLRAQVFSHLNNANQDHLPASVMDKLPAALAAGAITQAELQEGLSEKLYLAIANGADPREAVARLPGLDVSRLDPARFDAERTSHIHNLSWRFRKDDMAGSSAMYPEKYTPAARTSAMTNDVVRLVALANKGGISRDDVAALLAEGIKHHPEPEYAAARAMFEGMRSSLDALPAKRTPMAQLLS